MAVRPPCGFNCRVNNIYQAIKTQKKPFLKYSIFYLLLVEIASFFIKDLSNYSCYWYPLLTSIALFLVSFSFLLWSERLHFCYRKNIAVFFLSMYYLFQVVSFVIPIQPMLFYDVVSFGFIGISLITFFTSLLKSE